MQFLSNFDEYAKVLTIDSKEEGQRKLYPLLGSQRYALEEINRGLEDGIHTFVVLKGRQAGISTLCNAIDVYWLHKHKGMPGTLVCDDESNRETFRATITQFIHSLPLRYRIPVVAHNRTHLILENRSRLVYQVAGKKMSASSASLGQGKGIAFMHATECASWPDPQGVASLMASLAEKNPQRLFIFEGTPKGHNIWEDIWETAKRAVTQRAIFIGWYRNDKNRFPSESNEYKVYWDQQPRMTAQERTKAHLVKIKYGVDILPEQIAWYRFQHFEKFHEDEIMLTQEHPWDDEEAFVMSGSQWFHSKVVTDIWNVAHKKKFQSFRFHFAEDFEYTQLFDAIARHAELKVWEEPKPGGVYVVSADPAYGSSDNADRFVVQVLRCYADQLEQVAEYATVDCTTYAFAWVIMALCGAYKTTYFILEINGPGSAVFDEIKNVRRKAYASKMWKEDTSKQADLKNVVRNIRNYVWSKPDTATSASNTLHWKTNFENKSHMMNMLRDYCTRGLCHVNSEEAAKEMRKIVREPNGDIKGDGASKDDRVVALALAIVMYHQKVRPLLMQQGQTRAWVEKMQNESGAVQTLTQLMVIDALRAAGIKRRVQKIGGGL